MSKNGRTREPGSDSRDVLAQGAELFRGLSEHSLVGIYLVQDGVIRFANPTVAHLFGYDRDEMTGMNAEDLVSPQDWPIVRESLRRRIDGEVESAHYSFRARRKDGLSFEAEVYGSRVMFDGRPAVIGTLLDITERNRAEEALEVVGRFLRIANEHSAIAPLLDAFLAELREYTECAAVGVRILDEEGNIPYMGYDGFSQSFYESESPLSIRVDECMCIDVIKGTTDPKRSFYTPGGSFHMNGATRFLATVSEEEKGKTRNACNEAGYESVALVPIRTGRRILGLIHVADPRQGKVPLAMVEVLEGVAAQLGTAIRRVLTEETLRETRDYLESLLDHANAPVIVWDPSHRITRFNRAFEQLTGYSSDEVVGKELQMLFPEENREESLGKIAQTASGALWESVEIPILRKDGVVRIALWNSANILGEDGKTLVTTIAQGQDITARKEAEGALRESNERFDLAARGTNDGIWDWDIETDANYFSPRFLELLDYGPDELTHELATWESLLHPDDYDMALDAVRQHLEHRAPYDLEYRMRAKGGEYRWFRARGQATWDGSGKPLRMAGSVTDITKRKRAEEELRRALDDLEHSNRELEQFAYVASHDLQEPLRTITSYVQLLQRRHGNLFDAEAGEFIGYVTAATARMQQMIMDLLALSRVGTRGGPLESIDSGVALRRALDNLHATTTEHGAKISSGDMPIVVADETQLTQLFQNLIENAIKFHDGEPPLVAVSAKEQEGEWVFSVKDNGIGIDPEYFDRIFAVFQRLHSREQYNGTGIGLAICMKIVECHGGRMWVESEPEKGSTFYFTLPVKSANTETARQEGGTNG